MTIATRRSLFGRLEALNESLILAPPLSSRAEQNCRFSAILRSRGTWCFSTTRSKLPQRGREGVRSTACSSGASCPRAETFSTDSTLPSRTNSAQSKLFTVGQMCLGRRYSASPTCGPEVPSRTAMGRCSSLGESGVSSGCPRTTQVGTPASAETALCPASQVTIPARGRLHHARATTSAAGR